MDRTIYQKIGTGETAVYTYLGQIVYGTDAALPDGLKTTSRGYPEMMQVLLCRHARHPEEMR